jgi:quinol monooxygenase YgiN
MNEGEKVVTILWHATPFRGDKFEDAWRPSAAAALDYGASWWAFFRSSDDPLDFTQIGVWPDKKAWERYWYSEEISEARAAASGYYEVPILPIWHRVISTGAIQPVEAEST